MERWMAVHHVQTREEWEAQQPKVEPADRWDAWTAVCADADAVLRNLLRSITDVAE